MSRRVARGLAAATVVLGATACGVVAEDSPEPLPPTVSVVPPPSVTQEPAPATPSPTVTAPPAGAVGP